MWLQSEEAEDRTQALTRSNSTSDASAAIFAYPEGADVRTDPRAMVTHVGVSAFCEAALKSEWVRGWVRLHRTPPARGQGGQNAGGAEDEVGVVTCMSSSDQTCMHAQNHCEALFFQMDVARSLCQYYCCFSALQPDTTMRACTYAFLARLGITH